MAKAVRQGDTNSAGGSALGGASTVYAEGKAVMLPGNQVTPHGCCGSPGCGAHCAATTKGGSGTVFAEGKPLITTEDSDSCGHPRKASASSVYIGT